MNTDNLILRETDNLPLINKDDTLTSADLDGNFIKIYNDFLALSTANDPTLLFDIDRSYAIGEYATYNGKMWVSTIEVTGVTPDIDSLEWLDIFPTVLAHEKNKDTYLDYGGANATSVAEIRAFIDAGLTSTTNLTLTTKTGTSFKIESSTGSDVILPQATVVDAGLLNAEDKIKLNNTSGINTGDQTLSSLNAEDVDNKVTDFTTINDTLYPTTQAVDTYLTAQVPDLVEIFLDSNVEVTTNKAIDFTTVNDTKYPTVKAVDDHINSKLAGLWDDRGSYDASTNLFPSTGGSGGSGAIMKGDIWTINVQGTLGGTVMHVGDTVRALTDAPGQTSTNWALLENAIGYVPENVINKVTTFAGNTTSDTKYPSVKAVVDNFDATNIKSILGVTVLSGSNTGDQDLSGLMVKSNNLSDLTNTTTARTNLGLGTLATQNGTFSGTSSGTNTGDQIISDATISLTDITTNDVSINKHGFAPKAPNDTTKFLRGDGTWATPASGSSGGIWGIANSSGVYTYYATWALAVAAAVSGQVIELFADITETTSTYILKNGVNVQGNGHTITFASSTNGFDDNSVSCTVIFSNINLIKTTTADTAVIKCFNASSNITGYSASINTTIGSVFGFYGSGTIGGFYVSGVGYGILTRFGTSLNVNNCYVLGSIDGNGGTTIISNTYIKGNVSGSPSMNNCTVIATGGVAYTGNGKNITNCSFVSMTSNVIVGGGIFENCYIYSAAERPINVDTNTQFNNCYIESATLYINQINTSGNYYNCTLKTKLSYLFYGGTQKMYNCTLINEWNTTGVSFFRDCVNNVIVNNYIQVANSGTIINYTAGTQTVYMYGNAIKGTTNINSAGITNAQTNTADAQGNIILN